MWQIRATMLASVLLAVAAPAQDYEPRHETILKRALGSVSSGQCPPELMTPVVQYQCEKQIDALTSRFRSLGTLIDVTFRGTQQSPQGPTEVYLVRFQRGEVLWMIATDADGKLTMLWSPG